jgi:hypothetical protein
MTDLEKMELAMRRVLDHIKIQPHETGVETALQLIVDELKNANNLRKDANGPT